MRTVVSPGGLHVTICSLRSQLHSLIDPQVYFLLFLIDDQDKPSGFVVPLILTFIKAATHQIFTSPPNSQNSAVVRSQRLNP